MTKEHLKFIWEQVNIKPGHPVTERQLVTFARLAIIETHLREKAGVTE